MFNLRTILFGLWLFFVLAYFSKKYDFTFTKAVKKAGEHIQEQSATADITLIVLTVGIILVLALFDNDKKK